MGGGSAGGEGVSGLGGGRGRDRKARVGDYVSRKSDCGDLV